MANQVEASVSKGWFPETRWSLVLAAQSDGVAAAHALESLCQMYWKPVFTYARARGFSPEDAEDLTQDFFGRLLERDLLATSGPDKGRLRTYLAVLLRNHLENAREHAVAAKRGGAAIRIVQDVSESEALLIASPELPPDRLFDRHWAITLLGQVLDALRNECRESGKLELFEALKPALSGELPAGRYVEIAAPLQLSEGALRVALHRLRNRYRDLLLTAVAQTVGDDSAVESELRALLETV